MKVAYQGLAGAYSEAATAALFPADTPVPSRTFGEVFAALESSAVAAAVVPVENTHVGSVVDVYDLLRHHAGLQVIAEAVLRVRHCLLGLPGATLDGIRIARSHPQALAQVDDYLRGRGIEPLVTFDTAGAASEVADAGDPSVAAVASRRAAREYGLVVLAEAIETTPDNFTRFFALARKGDDHPKKRVPDELRAGPRKTSLAYATMNIPGALTRSLQPFATAGLQLTKIESRPSRAAPWDYIFYLDFEGDPVRTPATEAIALMKTCCAWVQVLGTYRAATAVLEPD
ncbi:MAG TPA: prephenate dehydratase domain-containing protein [Candidatus Limnocylindria bacterium]|nr:prephenate dehydratase domain-containing protein [Candidatus Limnocylindria bacterium]